MIKPIADIIAHPTLDANDPGTIAQWTGRRAPKPLAVDVEDQHYADMGRIRKQADIAFGKRGVN